MTPTDPFEIAAPSIAEIQRAVVEYFGMHPLDMTSERRARRVARPRQIAMYLAGELTRASFPMIGRKFGGRDHTTVMYAVKKIDQLRAENAYFAERRVYIGDAIDFIIGQLKPQA